MARGQLRIYLGAAPGVGKTFAMLNEGWRRSQRGTDVVIGFLETHERANTAAQVRDLPMIRRRTIEYRGTTFEEMDTEAILTRRPEVALVDELAHLNVPGSVNAKRWQDVEVLLEAGIDVISTVNIQHLESVNDVVEDITGVPQRETVPDQIVRRADQIELVDMSPEALRRRMAHGNIYAAEKVDAALGNYFRIGNLAALREIALMWVADQVDDALRAYRSTHGISQSWETRERVVVAVTGAQSGEFLIRRAARMAQRSRADLIGVHVNTSGGLAGAPTAQLDEHRTLLTDLGGEYHEVVGTDVAQALIQFARSDNASQIVLGSSARSRWRELVQGSVINAVVREAGQIDVHVISPPDDETDAARLRPPARKRRLPAISARRQGAAWLLAAIAIPVLVVVLHAIADDLALSTVMLLYLSLVTAVAVVGGKWPALTSAIVASLVVNWFFTEPVHTFTINRAENVVAVVVFVAVAAVVSLLVSRAARRTYDAARASAEAEALARVAGAVAGDDDPLDAVLGHLRSSFDLDVVTVLQHTPDPGSTASWGGHWTLMGAVGEPVPQEPGNQERFDLADHAVLLLDGPDLAAEDRRVLQAFVAQLDVALERCHLHSEATQLAAVTEADRLRTAILRAVSHDLRTPLASIKASVSSLLQQDVDWSEEESGEFLSMIDEETDRLNLLVGNLLDMSRLEAGVVHAKPVAVGLEEVIGSAMASISGGAGPRAALARAVGDIDLDVSEKLPEVWVDPVLLERALANIIANALRHSPGDEHVRIEAAVIGPSVHLRIVDRGPGVSLDARTQMFEPFQRLGDQAAENGVGLGLAVARGFIGATGAEVALDDTPGGGLTVVVSVPVAP